MTEVSALINAVMLLPINTGIDSTRARLCLLHAERHGYQLVGIVYDWTTALIKMRGRHAQVCILADPEDFHADWTPRIEFVGDDTQEILRYGHIRHPRNESPSVDPRQRRPGAAS